MAKKLLIVDDASAIRKAICQIVEPLGFDVAEAEDGEQALAYCMRESVPEGILLDIDMPIMDGLSFLRVIRQNARYDTSQVVMCTTHNSIERVSEALSAGANEYVMKPFDQDIIKLKLEAVGLI